MNNRELQRKFDRVAASRLSRIEGGVPRHIALSNRASITLRNKLKRTFKPTFGFEVRHDPTGQTST
jgi:hypothetical protein